MVKQLLPALRLTVAFTVLTGMIYPAVVTGICQVLFPRQANGSLIVRNGQVIGSSLIGQNFAQAKYFAPRPSAAGSDGYDASNSGASNYGPTSKALMDRVTASIAAFRHANPDYHGPIPADLVTASASGLDPDISPASALAQAARVAQARGVTLEQIDLLIAANTQAPTWGILGDPRVNVLELNLALDRQYSMTAAGQAAER